MGQNTGPEGRGRGRSPRCLGGRVGPENQLRAVDMGLKRTDEVLRERGRSMRQRKEQRVLEGLGWALKKHIWSPVGSHFREVLFIPVRILFGSLFPQICSRRVRGKL